MKRGRDTFNKFKPLINLLVSLHRLMPKFLRIKIFGFYQTTKGKKGLIMRYILLKTLAREVGDNVAIHPNVYLFNIENLSLGNNVSIHPMCYLEAKGNIIIKDDVSIAHSVTILSVNHIFKDLKIPIKEQGITMKETVINENVWVGAKASILEGVTIGSGAIVATGAVVNKNVNTNNIVGGVPAKTISIRS